MQTPRSPPIASSRIALVDRDNPHKEVRFARDSPLEGAGFEPSVPRLRRSSVRCRPQLMQPETSQADACQQPSSFPGGHAFSDHTKKQESG
jgi:hypothetical protein